MSQKIPSEPDADDGSEEPDVSAEEVRDLFIDEERLDVSAISQHFEIEEESHVEDLLDRLAQSGIIEKTPRSPVKGGSYWTLKNPQLRVRSASEVAGESPLTQKAVLDEEPRDEEATIEDVLELLAKYEERRGDLTTARIAVNLQITARRARDLADELVDRGVAEKRTAPKGSDMFWLAEGYTLDDVEALLGDPEPEIDPTEQLNDALSD